MIKYKTRKIKFWGTLILIIVLITISRKFVVVKKIECYTQFGQCPPEIATSLTGWTNKPLLWFLPTSKINQQLSRFPQISHVDINRRLPSTLVIVLQLRRPIGLINNSVLGAATVVDETGLLTQTASSSSLPLLLVNQQLELNHKLNPDQLKALEVLSSLTALSNNQIVGNLNQTTLSVNLPPGIEVLLDINRPQSEWYSSLQLIIARSRIMAKMPQKIDLRFNNSVITY